MHDDRDTVCARATNDDEIIKMNCSTTKQRKKNNASTDFDAETADRPTTDWTKTKSTAK